ncbi:hypothetical protein PTTG_06180 [Puccinia triticina 1-1 BBBD Race 1]|uniref:Uncharacterized protein n=1 Tax=Puccinia triticina (isolate 1-1 / race 1 (BBBD)) TaxID=630390 RepID=A0A180GD05_PUCT1|nr:hypothetical protein PTTG_06180 [Puccinia triticina 1-1 BBBD Race 1]
MLKLHPLTVQIGCATAFIQASQSAAAAVLLKRSPQKTAPENGLANSTSVTNAPLVLYASDSSPTSSTQASSPAVSPHHGVLFVVLSGASAFSIITLAFLIIYRRYKAHKLGTSRLSPSHGDPTRVHGGGHPSVEKSQIRHITHDEQKEKYRSLFGVPAGYLRPKSRISSLAPPPATYSLQVSRYSNSLVGLQTEAGMNDSRYSSSSDIERSHETSFYPSAALTDEEAYLDRKQRHTRVISFEEDSGARPLRELREEEQEIVGPISRFSNRFPNLVARLKSIKQKTICKGANTTVYRPGPYSLSPNNFHSILRTVSEADSEGASDADSEPPRSPSIAPTPPHFIKSPIDENAVMNKPIDLAIVTHRLEHQLSVQRSTFSGRGDSFYWKSPPRSDQ